jgi:predicted 2-oxoglutarate/Fe(II)-dependent dioxygenase YbiX
MIPDKLTDYVGIYPNHFSDDLCKSACASLDKTAWQKHYYYNHKTRKNTTFEDDLSVTSDEIPERAEIDRRIWEAIEQYIIKDLKDFEEWFDGWNGHTIARFNRYDEKTLMRIHCDHIHAMFDGERRGVPILTVLGILNDNYTGGEFVMFGDQQINLPAGSVIVFPSNFMFPHEVKPVKKGVRYSCVSWAW